MGGFRRFGEAPEVELSDRTFEPGLLRPGRLPALIHPSAWNRNSRKFAVASAPSSVEVSTPEQHGASPSASKRADLVAFVAPSRSKVLRVVTALLPEQSCTRGPGLNRTSPCEGSANFAFTEF